MPHTRHPRYYFKDMVLLVEDTLFRVPSFIFRDSEVFQDMWSLPQGDAASIEGSDDEHPLVLSNYLAQDFEQLLKVLIPRQYPPEKPKLSAEEWISVLKLATAWNFEAVRQTAIDELATYGADDPILRLVVAKRFNILRWFMPSMETLARREAPLSSTDFERLEPLGAPQGICKFMLKIAQVRESFSSTPSPPGAEPCSLGGATYHCHTYNYYSSTTFFCGASGSSGNARARGDHDFTEAIQQIFDCESDSDASGNGSLVPKSSSWDFT